MCLLAFSCNVLTPVAPLMAKTMKMAQASRWVATEIAITCSLYICCTVRADQLVNALNELSFEFCKLSFTQFHFEYFCLSVSVYLCWCIWWIINNMAVLSYFSRMSLLSEGVIHKWSLEGARWAAAVLLVWICRVYSLRFISVRTAFSQPQSRLYFPIDILLEDLSILLAWLFRHSLAIVFLFSTLVATFESCLAIFLRLHVRLLYFEELYFWSILAVLSIQDLLVLFSLSAFVQWTIFRVFSFNQGLFFPLFLQFLIYTPLSALFLELPLMVFLRSF